MQPRNSVFPVLITFFILFGFFSAMFYALAGPAAASDIYFYRDEEGVYHYSNTPTDSKYVPMDLGPANGRVIYSDTAYDSIIADAAEVSGLQFALVKAVIKAESNFNPRAVSRAGAMGLMQIMPANLEDFDLTDPFDPEANIRAGVNYLQQLIKRYDGNLHLALAAYNAGPTTVDRYTTIPPYRETWKYVQRVLAHYDRYAQEGP